MSKSEDYLAGWNDALNMVNGIVGDMLDRGQFDSDTLDYLEQQIEEESESGQGQGN